MAWCKKIFFFLITLVLFASCTLQKRNYLPGYHVAWKGAASNVNNSTGSLQKHKKNSAVILPNVKPFILPVEKITAVKAVSASLTKQGPQKIYTGIKTYIDNCDTLFLRNGTEIKAKVLEITQDEIKYKYCNNLDGPLIIIAKNDVEHITYSNGETERFKIERQNTTTNSNWQGMDETLRARKDARDSLIMGILAFPGMFIYLVGVVLAIMAIIAARRALKILLRNPRENTSFISKARTGMILGIIIVALVALGLGFAFAILFGVI